MAYQFDISSHLLSEIFSSCWIIIIIIINDNNNNYYNIFNYKNYYNTFVLL